MLHTKLTIKLPSSTQRKVIIKQLFLKLSYGKKWVLLKGQVCGKVTSLYDFQLTHCGVESAWMAISGCLFRKVTKNCQKIATVILKYADSGSESVPLLTSAPEELCMTILRVHWYFFNELLQTAKMFMHNLHKEGFRNHCSLAFGHCCANL